MILFYTEGNAIVGMGHCVRSVALAEALREHPFRPAVAFHVDKWSEPAAWYVRAHGFPLWRPGMLPRPTATVQDRVESVREGPAPVFELVDELHEAMDRSNAFSAFDDPGNAILRRQFGNQPNRLVRKDPLRILLSFGGADPCHLTEIVGPLAVETGLHVTATVGPAFGFRPGLMSGPAYGMELVQGGEDMAYLLAHSDVVLCSGGMTVLEAAACGTPALVVSQNGREHERATRLANMGLCYYAGPGYAPRSLIGVQDSVRSALGTMLRDWRARHQMAHVQQSKVDGLGALVVADRIISRIHEEEDEADKRPS